MGFLLWLIVLYKQGCRHRLSWSVYSFSYMSRKVGVLYKSVGIIRINGRYHIFSSTGQHSSFGSWFNFHHEATRNSFTCFYGLMTLYTLVRVLSRKTKWSPTLKLYVYILEIINMKHIWQKIWLKTGWDTMLN